MPKSRSKRKNKRKSKIKSKRRSRSRSRSRNKSRTQFKFNSSKPHKTKTSKSWLVYTKDGCPHCEAAIKLLKEKNYSVISKRGEDYKEEIEEKLLKAGRSDFKTWPKVFSKDGIFIGGNQDLLN